MKITHVPFCFYPDPVGGTEVYVDSLARHLIERGIDATVAAPGNMNSAYDFKGLPVKRFAVRENLIDLSELYGEGDPWAAMAFAKILDIEQPDIVHFHAFTRGASLRLIREANRRGMKTFFTYHTPTVSCQRGTLMRWGTELCDGVLDTHQCAACTLQGLGVSETLARCLGSLPRALGSLPGKFGVRGGPWTALRMAELVELRLATFRALTEEVDHLVALCRWTKELLTRNGVPADKITISRHGINQTSEVGVQTSDVSHRSSEIGDTALTAGDRQSVVSDHITPVFCSGGIADRALRMAFLGRLDHSKGADILIQALRRLPDAPVELHFYGIIQSEKESAQLKRLKGLANDDRRIRFFSSVPSEHTVALLRRYHLLAVPSQLLETGPLVALEAFAAGIPVMGSNLGGIAELVRHEIDGWLVEPSSIDAWAQAIHRFCDDRSLLDHLRLGIKAPRTMDAVAGEMLLLYRESGQRNKRIGDDISEEKNIHALV
ncbi:MAG: glycosyltransferase [Deltaproteobacteria bacterium]|nr:glycosyltransferase [Deltaproteobacteria bacterium]